MSQNTFQLPEIETLATLLPAFEFEHLIAQGGMGAVYKARQRSLDRDVAIKILPRELGKDPVFHECFRTEARAMARLTHPNLVRVFDSGDVDGLLYIVMEYVPGKSLHHSAYGKAIESGQAVEIIIAACKGLAHAHENGIVHRDIKPANILLTPERQPKIGDFGLARHASTDTEGPAMGTPGYMAPELVNNPGKGDPQSDVYAIGIVLRELITGVPAASPDAAKSVVPDFKLAVICRKATHADPALRYRDTASLADQLARWLAAKKTSTRTFSTVKSANSNRPSPLKKPVRVANQSTSRNWALLRNCAVIAFLLCGIHLLWGAYQTKRDTIARIQKQEVTPVIKVIHLDTKKVAVIPPSNGLGTTLASGHP